MASGYYQQYNGVNQVNHANYTQNMPHISSGQQTLSRMCNGMNGSQNCFPQTRQSCPMHDIPSQHSQMCHQRRYCAQNYGNTPQRLSHPFQYTQMNQSYLGIPNHISNINAYSSIPTPITVPLNNHSSNTSSCTDYTDCTKKHVCSECGKRFRYFSLLDRHITSHSTAKPHLCDFPGCNKRFQHKYYLNQHKRRTHNAIKKHKCTECSKAFVEKCNLKIHMRKHTGEKPYQCHVCFRRFSVKTNLDAHLRIHNNEKPFQCQICQKKFARKAYLTQHTRIHTGERPFQCEFCGKRCTQIGDLKKHIRIHTGEKPFKCSICSKQFRYSSHLKTHSRKSHPI